MNHHDYPPNSVEVPSGMPVFASPTSAIDDPWKHRSAGMRCSSCMWFVRKTPDEVRGEMAPARVVGRCRRHAPTMNGFPVVTTNDWCGDHRVDETKEWK